MRNEPARGVSRNSFAVRRVAQELRETLTELRLHETTFDYIPVEKVSLDECAEYLANAIFAFGDDCRVRNGNPHRVLEQRRYREPVGKSAHH